MKTSNTGTTPAESVTDPITFLFKDSAIEDHFVCWLLEHVHAANRSEVETNIRLLLLDNPELLDGHSWPEIRRMAESAPL